MSVAETAALDRPAFEARREAAEPFVMRGAAAEWPAVQAPDARALFAQLARLDTGAAQDTLIGGTGTQGRFFYSDDYGGQNYSLITETLTQALSRLLSGRHADGAYVQSIGIARHMPGLADANRLDLVPDGVGGRAWIGTPTTVQTHWDASENVAVCVLGRRHVTLFPPTALPGLYPGPLETAPGRTMVSRVDLRAPDLERFPRFAAVRDMATEVELAPGDALYIPCGWWHRIEARSPLNMLVNYWWSDGEAMVDNQWAAVILAMAALQHLPDAQRDVWRGVFDHFVFRENGQPMADLPPAARGFLGGLPPDAKRWAVTELLAVLGPEVGLKPPG